MHWLHRLFSILVVVLVVTASLAVTATVPVRAQERVDISEILDDPENWIGEEVIVRGDVAEVLSRQAIVLEADETGENLLVVGVRGVIARSIGEDFTVRVIGTARMFDPDDPEGVFQEAGIDPEDDIFSEFEDEPVIVADRVRVLAAPGNLTEEDDIEREPAERIDLVQIFEDPVVFFEERVTVVGEIEELFDGPAFSLSRPDALDNDDGGIDELLVIYGEGTDELPTRLAEDDLIIVTGTVGEFDLDDPFEAGGPAFEDEDAGVFGNDIDEFEGEPVIVADAIRILAPVMGRVVEDILEDPDEWIGETVTVFGRVEETLSLAGFTLEGSEGFLGITQDNLLVIGSPDVIPTDVFMEDVIVQVTGMVRYFDPDDPELLEEEASEDLAILVEGDEFDAFESEPVIVADFIEVLAVGPGETIEAILDDPDDFIGDEVTVAGNVSEILDRQAFTLEGEEGIFGFGDSDLLVVGDRDAISLVTEDTIVVVTGEVFIFDPDDPFEIDGEEVEDDLAFLFDGEFDEFEGDPIVVAEVVTPIVVD